MDFEAALRLPRTDTCPSSDKCSSSIEQHDKLQCLSFWHNCMQPLVCHSLASQHITRHSQLVLAQQNLQTVTEVLRQASPAAPWLPASSLAAVPLLL